MYSTEYFLIYTSFITSYIHKEKASYKTVKSEQIWFKQEIFSRFQQVKLKSF